MLKFSWTVVVVVSKSRSDRAPDCRLSVRARIRGWDEVARAARVSRVETNEG